MRPIRLKPDSVPIPKSLMSLKGSNVTELVDTDKDLRSGSPG
jgi:hypothetical protein